MKQIILLNIVNLFLLGLVAAGFFALPIGVASLLAVAVTGFALYSNYVLIVRDQDDDYLLRHADKKGFFRRQVEQFIIQKKSLEQRVDVVQDDEKLQEVYELVCTQVHHNIETAMKFMEMYDYIQKPSTQYLDDLYLENKHLIDNFNEVVEQFIKIENSVHDVDVSYIDDLLVTLKEMK